jgi:hypothetical protein
VEHFIFARFLTAAYLGKQEISSLSQAERLKTLKRVLLVFKDYGCLAEYVNFDDGAFSETAVPCVLGKA